MNIVYVFFLTKNKFSFLITLTDSAEASKIWFHVNLFAATDFVLQQSCIEEREHLQVYLRIRPFTSAERNSGESQVKVQKIGKQASYSKSF